MKKILLFMLLLSGFVFIPRLKLKAMDYDMTGSYFFKLEWLEVEADSYKLGIKEGNIDHSLTDIPDLVNLYQGNIVTFNELGIKYPGHNEIYPYWIFDYASNELLFTNYSIAVERTVLFINIVDLISDSNKSEYYKEGYNEGLNVDRDPKISFNDLLGLTENLNYYVGILDIDIYQPDPDYEELIWKSPVDGMWNAMFTLKTFTINEEILFIGVYQGAYEGVPHRGNYYRFIVYDGIRENIYFINNNLQIADIEDYNYTIPMFTAEDFEDIDIGAIKWQEGYNYGFSQGNLIGYNEGSAEGYELGKNDFAFNAGNGDLITNEIVNSDKASSYYTIELDVEEELGFNGSSTYDDSKVRVYGNNSWYRENKVNHDDIVLFNRLTESFSELTFTAPFGYYFTKVDFILKNSDLPLVTNGLYAESMSLLIDNNKDRYSVNGIKRELVYSRGVNVITFINDSIDGNPLTIGELEFTLEKALPQGLLKANQLSLLKDYYEKAYKAYGGLSSRNNYEKLGFDKAFAETYVKGYEVFGQPFLPNNDSYNYKEGYQKGLLSTENESFQEGYNEGYLKGSNDSFMAGLEKWIVPAIIMVLVAGGFIYYRSRRGEE